MKNEEKVNMVEKLLLVGICIIGFCGACYWKYRYNKAVTEGCLWTLQAIEKMEEQRKLIESLQKGASI